MPELPENLVRTLESLDAEFDRLSAQLEDPAIAADHRKARSIASRRKAIEATVGRYRELRRIDREIADLASLAAPGGDRELAALATADLPPLRSRRDGLVDTVRRELVTGDDRSIDTVILEVRMGVGGLEAALWAGELVEMYRRHAARRGWRFDPLESTPGDQGGVTEAIVELTGDGVWSELGYEGGTHQVKRVPATEAQGRVHTSTATVAVLPEPDEIEAEVDASEVKEMLTTAQGPGGQNVNKVATAVHLIHLPTGIEVRMQETRSQLQNREKAWRLLRARVHERRRREAEAKRSAERISMIGSGDRAEKIRTYRFKENLAVDHRLERGFNLKELLSGELDALVGALAERDIDERIAAL
jgi:peptide chain release factor 1